MSAVPRSEVFLVRRIKIGHVKDFVLCGGAFFGMVGARGPKSLVMTENEGVY